MVKVAFTRKGLIIGEPIWREDMSDAEKTKTIQDALNFYASDASKKALKPDLFRYLKEHSDFDKSDIAHLKLRSDKISFVAYKMARMVHVGLPNTDDIKDNIVKECNRVLRKYPVNDEAEVQQKPKTSPLERLQAKVESTVIVELEDMLDEWSNDVKSRAQSMDILKSIQANEIPPKGFQYIYSWCNRQLDELGLVLEKNDPDFVEAYDYVPHHILRTWKKAIERMIADVEHLEHKKKKKRAKRRQQNARPKNRFQAIKQLKKKVDRIKFQEEDIELGLKSIDPEKIIGLRDLWAYNTKYCQLIHWTALSRDGLDVRGTTLQNIDSKLSFRIRLRKPGEFLQLLKDNPNIDQKKLMSEVDKLTTKKGSTNGRINDNTILLKVYE